jgi:hypothetical protein
MQSTENNFKEKLFNIAISIDERARKTWIALSNKFKPANPKFKQIKQ